MKTLLLFFLVLISYFSIAQTVELKIGAGNYVTIDNNNYVRGYLGSVYEFNGTDSTLAIYVNSGFPKSYYPSQYSNMYLDGNNNDSPFHSMASLIIWMNTNFECLDTPIIATSGYGLIKISNYLLVDTGIIPNRSSLDSVIVLIPNDSFVFDTGIVSGDTVTMIVNSDNYIIAATGTTSFTTLVLRLPSSPNNGDSFGFKFQRGVTTLTWINGSVGQFTFPKQQGGDGNLRYNSILGKWY